MQHGSSNAAAPAAAGTTQAVARILLKPKEDLRIVKGHRWVFSNEIGRVEGEPAPGAPVEVSRADGRIIGMGLYNPGTLIAVRMVTAGREPIDRALFVSRLRRALILRKRLYPEYDSFRVCHGESDDLPGLIVDKFADCLAIQTLCLGMDLLKETICDALDEVFHPRSIVERNESHLREREGLPVVHGVLRGENVETAIIEEADLRFEVALLAGQKTGFYFDQRENRIFMRRFAPGSRVLDAYCHEGSFALHAVKAGAAAVLGIDISAEAIQRARHNALLNTLEAGCQFEALESSEAMESLHAKSERFDVVMLDPPSFTRSRKNVPAAKKGYEEVNRRAIRILKRGGILATSSCSFHITDETFLECIQEAAFKANRILRLLEWRSQAPDHPILPCMPETRYLKFGAFQVD